VILGTLLAFNIVVLSSNAPVQLLFEERLPRSADTQQDFGGHTWQLERGPSPRTEVEDQHPLRELMLDADTKWLAYTEERSQTFKETVHKYRERYGRHPPPGFKQWYKFARERHVFNLDDFYQIHDDLRPFWAIEPKEIRTLAAHVMDVPGHDFARISIRHGQIWQKLPGWRSSTFVTMLKAFVHYLPSMDIPLNRMDQPRVVVPWAQMQEHLAKELKTRSLSMDAVDGFTVGLSEIFVPESEHRGGSDMSTTSRSTSAGTKKRMIFTGEASHLEERNSRTIVGKCTVNDLSCY